MADSASPLPTGKPHLPPEISTQCLRFVSPLEAWSNRIICKNWRDYVENVLAQSIWLPTMKVTIDGGMLRDKDEHKRFVACEFLFDTLIYDEPEDGPGGPSAGPNVEGKEGGGGKEGEVPPVEVEHDEDDPCRIAQFVDFRALELYDDEIRQLTRKGCMRKSKKPHIWLPVAGIVNDIHIPDLKIDWKTFTLEMDWRAVLVLMMKEEMEAARRKVKCKELMMEATLALKVQMQQDGVDVLQGFDVMLDHWVKYKEEVDEVYETLRQQRMGDELDEEGWQTLKNERAEAEGMAWLNSSCKRDETDSDAESEDDVVVSDDPDDELARFEGHDLVPVAEE